MGTAKKATKQIRISGDAMKTPSIEETRTAIGKK
jgi:hypothetical protein